MKNDVFISYSTADKHVADAICSTFENSGIRCWIAPRDILPGSDWAASIVDAIKNSKIMVLVFSKHSNNSSQVTKELNLAISHNVMVVPFKIDDSMPSGKMEYFLADMHWLDAIDGDMQVQIENLKNVIVSVLPHTLQENIHTPTPQTVHNDLPQQKAKLSETPVSDAPETDTVQLEKKKKNTFLSEYITMWKKCLDFKGSATKTEFRKATLQSILVVFIAMTVIASIGFDSTYLSGIMGVIFIALPIVSIIPHISLCIRYTRGIGKSKLLFLPIFVASVVLISGVAFAGVTLAFIILYFGLGME